jgi:hypothetical protein
MQFSKISGMICAAAICASPFLVRAEDTEAQAKLREAMRQKMAESHAQPPAAASAVKVAKPVESRPAAAAPKTSVQVKPTDDAAHEAAMRQALTKAMDEKNSATTAAKPAVKAAVAKPPAKVSAATPETAVPVMAPLKYDPNLPLSAEKQERLNTLLEKYMADQVTPQEYHEQRAKILAE